MWGIIPAAGNGTRIQPLAFSKELLPVGSRTDENGAERPKAVSEYLVERMIAGGATKICFVISPTKSDIVRYYGGGIGRVDAAFVVQPQAAGLCDAIFRACPLVASDELVLVGLPDTIWFPEDALARLPDDVLSFLLFPVERPELFDAVVLDDDDRVRENTGQAARRPVALGLGRLQDAGSRAARAVRAVARAGPRRRVYRHARQCLARARQSGGRRARGRALCRCRHARRLSGGRAAVGRTAVTDWPQRLASGAPIEARVAVVVAHPDDESLWAGALLGRLRDGLLIHLTDGAPEDMADAARSGFGSRQAYSDKRAAELRLALRLLGYAGERRGYGLRDQSAVEHLPELTERLSADLRGAAVVATHAYEGGHPDHDAAALAGPPRGRAPRRPGRSSFRATIWVRKAACGAPSRPIPPWRSKAAR
jgi:hypothetical protein